LPDSQFSPEEFKTARDANRNRGTSRPKRNANAGNERLKSGIGVIESATARLFATGSAESHYTPDTAQGKKICRWFGA
jgi:hypothetical protein